MLMYGKTNTILQSKINNNNNNKALMVKKNLEQRLDSQKYDIKKTNQSHKIIIYILYNIMFALKISGFFCKLIKIVGYKMKIKGVIEDLNI